MDVRRHQGLECLPNELYDHISESLDAKSLRALLLVSMSVYRGFARANYRNFQVANLSIPLLTDRLCWFNRNHDAEVSNPGTRRVSASTTADYIQHASVQCKSLDILEDAVVQRLYSIMDVAVHNMGRLKSLKIRLPGPPTISTHLKWDVAALHIQTVVKPSQSTYYFPAVIDRATRADLERFVVLWLSIIRQKVVGLRSLTVPFAVTSTIFLSSGYADPGLKYLQVVDTVTLPPDGSAYYERDPIDVIATRFPSLDTLVIQETTHELGRRFHPEDVAAETFEDDWMSPFMDTVNRMTSLRRLAFCVMMYDGREDLWCQLWVKDRHCFLREVHQRLREEVPRSLSCEEILLKIRPPGDGVENKELADAIRTLLDEVDPDRLLEAMRSTSHLEEVQILQQAILLPPEELRRILSVLGYRFPPSLVEETNTIAHVCQLMRSKLLRGENNLEEVEFSFVYGVPANDEDWVTGDQLPLVAWPAGWDTVPH